MTADPPVVDGRDAEAIAREARERAPYYTDEWDPDSGDAGTALLEVFSRIAGDVTERLDRAPEKHRVAFLDRLGFGRRPPRPARLPVSFQVSDGAAENVPIPGGTEAVAEVGGAERTFEIPPADGFEATPSSLTRVYSVAPQTDQLFEHWSALRAEGPAEVPVLDGTDAQDHALYVGGAELLDLQPGSTVQLTFQSSVPGTLFRDCLEWEYYGEEERDGETVAGWYPLRVRGRDPAGDCDWSELQPVETFLDRVEPRLRWLGFRPADDLAPGARYRLLASLVADVQATPEGTTADRARDPSLPEHLLPPMPADERAAVAAALRGPLRELTADLRRVTDRTARRRRTGPTGRVALDFVVPGTATEFEVAGIESRWLRCRLPRDDLASGLFDVEVVDIRLAVGPGAVGDVDRGEGEEPAEGLAPDAAFADGVPLQLDGQRELLPFGDDPQRLDTFYVASREAFTKAETDVELWFAATGTREVGDGAPRVSWEYWNGTGWARIDGLHDATVELTEGGRVAFSVPRDLEPTTVAGHDGHWIRARLVGGTYGQPSYAEIGDGTWARIGIDPPRFDDLRLHYDRESPPAHVLTHNNREFRPDPDSGSSRLRPFRPLPDESQALYLGFDRPLSDGPLQLLFSLADQSYPDWFYPRLQWEYCTDDESPEWTPPAVSDGTEGLTRRGVVGLVFPTETTATRLFGDRRHWVRARVTGDPFALATATAFVRRTVDGANAARDGPRPAQRTVETEPSTADALPTLPVIEGLHLNAGWAYDTRTVAGELLGSSDGTPGQTFDVSTPPATGAEVRVDELTALSTGRQRELAETRPEGTEAVTGPDGDVRRFWVRWERVAGFLDSGPDDRHYTLDGATGRVTFGDGVSGRVPPRGRDNVVASYRTGGGGGGNVPAGSLAALKSSIPLVDGVRNPGRGDGGADEESTAEAVRRASRRLRDRDRAVTDADLERIAASAAGDIARVRCLRMDRTGEPRPGWVTLLVLPETTSRTPTPTVELRERIREALGERAPASLLGSRRLVIRGPSYVAVSVTAAVQAATGTGSISSLEEEAIGALERFFHPLSGGPAGEGWEFGELPYLSDLYALLEGIDGVDHVDDLAVTFRGSGEPVVVREGDPLPAVGSDVLVRSGAHEIRASGGT